MVMQLSIRLESGRQVKDEGCASLWRGQDGIEVAGVQRCKDARLGRARVCGRGIEN